MAKVSVVLFNLGGPDSQKAVLPFLRNLFRDKAILRYPWFFRIIIAEIIARVRAPKSKNIYKLIGGSSPILQQCEDQVKSLTKSFNSSRNFQFLIAMRYWNPRAKLAYKEIAIFNPDKIILLPLYPQFSSTTTGSSIAEWGHIDQKKILSIGCYPALDEFITSFSNQIAPLINEASKIGTPRILFSAHGLPKKIAYSGDPYIYHVEISARAISKKLKLDPNQWRICYQSRVGPVEWIGPYLDDEIINAGKDAVPIVVVPISFTSEHSETLVELDIEYAELAQQNNVTGYFRAPTVTNDPIFIEALKHLITAGLENRLLNCPRDSRLLCPAQVCTFKKEIK